MFAIAQGGDALSPPELARKVVALAKAKEFLIENIISLKEIAERTGFGECNYLSRQFRRREGISPLRFRKQFNP